MPRTARFTLLLLIVTLLPGCPAIQWYTRQSTRGAVRGVYEGLADLEQPLRGQAMSRILQDPILRQTAHDVTAAVVLGVVDGLTQAKISRLSEKMVQDTVGSLKTQGGEAMNKFVSDAGPLLEVAMRRGIENAIMALGESMHKSAESDLGAATNILVKAAIDGMMTELRKSGKDLLHDLSGDTEAYLQQKVAPSAGLVARTVTREAMLGLQDGFQQSGMHDQLPALRMTMREIGIGLGEGLGQGLGKSVSKSPLEPILIGLSAGLTLLFAATVVWLILLWRRYMHITKQLADAQGPTPNLTQSIDRTG